MRPRHTAAENRRLGHPTVRRLHRGFNEAAAYSRGKRRSTSARIAPTLLASMRPRHTAAENRFECDNDLLSGLRFNEAAAYSRGKPSDATASRSSPQIVLQ